MGRKISVDSATLMNKGLEVIEACWLFHAQPHQIDVIIHPESILHSMVQYKDGSAIAQLGVPDMRTAITYALSWPNRITSGVQLLNLTKIGTLHFEAPDFLRFPCLNLALAALKAAGDAPAILNAANEIAVEAFLHEKIGFCDIAIVVENTLHRLAHKTASQDLSALMACDQEARIIAEQEVNKR
jgi:1-deoxy-D-xylulose-5-phosphate reductoisomerase